MRRLLFRMQAMLDAAMAASAQGFIDAWGRLERIYKRPSARIALRLRFAFYPLLAVIAIGWLGWDWTHGRSLDAAENAVFDQVIQHRPLQPKPSGRVVVVEIDECSLEYFRARGEGGWPWSRQRHADLLDALDRAGAKAVGYDVLFADPSPEDPIGDETLEAMAEGGAGRFVFAATRLDPDYDANASLHAAQAPGAFALAPGAKPPGPKVALLLPYGRAMAANAAVVNAHRNQDGVVRDVYLREEVGDWAIPALPLRLAAFATGKPASAFPAKVRINWRSDSPIPSISAADLLAGKPICRDAGETAPPLQDRIVLVGYTASGLNDAKPTPVDPMMPGVQTLAEATEALVMDSAIRMPPASLKYLLAALLVALTAFAFWRGEPANDVDSIFVAINLLLLAAAFAGLTFFGKFFDIYASIGYVSLCFGLCRMYAGIQRGRAVGVNDFLAEYAPARDRWLLFARLRFVPAVDLAPKPARRRRREYRRRLRRFLYAGSEAVMMEGVVERKSWLHANLDDLMLLVWKGEDEAAARAAAQHDLDRLYVHFNEQNQRLDDDGFVRVAVFSACIDDNFDDSDRGERLRLREALGEVLVMSREWPLSAGNTFITSRGNPVGDS